MQDKLEVTKEQIKAEVSKARKELDNTDFYGPFGHNVVGLILRDVANKVGTKYANELVEEYDLQDIGIYPVEE